MLSRAALLLVACAFIAISFAGHAGEKKSLNDDPETAARLRLNGVEYSILLDRYEDLLKRETDLKDRMKLFTGSALEKQRQPLKETQDDLDAVKKKVAQLESERQKLLRALGKTPGAAPVERDRIGKILDRLDAIEKRLDKMERSR